MIEDPHFIDAMVQELKSQGLFDQFRKECLADVDTKPAYQNLRQRVEGTVNKFLVQQEWSDNIRYKNQLRDQLRKNIIDSGFLDTGVERIVDQVVNPKIATIFQPKVEEIVYNYLGIEKPKSSFNGNDQASSRSELLLEDLEAVSPDSDKKSEGSVTPPPQPPPPPPPEPSMEHFEENMEIDESLDESKEQDDFESPAFEPLEVRSPVQSASKVKEEINDSNSSAISGLTSQESLESRQSLDVKADNLLHEVSKEPAKAESCDEQDNQITKDSDFSQEIAPTNDSQLSQVSSNSQLLTTAVPSSSEEFQRPEENERLDITEEAQMPTLFSSSTDKVSSSTEGDDGADVAKKITFDFEKDEYDFVGTVRPSIIACADDSCTNVNRDGDPEEDSMPTTTRVETPTDTPTPTKDSEQPNLTPQDDETSQSEHSLKICEDSFSDEDTKESKSFDEHARDSPSKIKGLSDASSCSMKCDREVTNIPSNPKNDSNDKPQMPDQPADENTKEANCAKTQEKSSKSEIQDDHYQERLKLKSDRRSSDRDSEDGDEKHDPSGPSVPPSNDNIASSEKTITSQETTEKPSEKEKSPVNDPIDSPLLRMELHRRYGSVTPTGENGPIDSSSSGIQSGDDSEKSPETLKSYCKPESIILPVQPVVIDQMLTNTEDSKLKRLLNGDTHTDDATLESLQRQWQWKDEKARKPKYASNLSEARRLMKVRKQMQRKEQKCRDQTLAMAKKYISGNKTFDGQAIEDQGIELEFVCDGKRKSPGPLISSPVPKLEQPIEEEQPIADPELLYFPEDNEEFKIDETRLNYLRSKTEGVTFSKSFKVQHYRTKIFSLTVTTPVQKSAKRPITDTLSSAKPKRNCTSINGLSKTLDLASNGHNAASLALQRQRSIRNRLTEKNTPPSVGTDTRTNVSG
ncbi:biorientation of chromosomes in cell division protein 1-like 1 [Anopheles nili]|uniref:biorientation of chromosomes in cell division protein 1-like 1 n=1 Tax=Anopheles nili TaxID=185578 RepID=UPI00237B9300|nr:biorientation of chromosomes in cell division protein 1-like 1 [Anopheles nili]